MLRALHNAPLLSLSASLSAFVSFHPRSFADHATLHSPSCCLCLCSILRQGQSVVFVSLSLLFATCASASKRSNAPASQHGPAPPSCITVSLDLHDLHESPRASTAYKQTSRTGEKGTECFSNVSSTTFHPHVRLYTPISYFIFFGLFHLASISSDRRSSLDERVNLVWRTFIRNA